MKFLLEERFANGICAFLSEGERKDLIGHHYPLLRVSQFEFRTDVEAYCETDMHYWERKSKEPIPEGEKVEPLDIWSNFYGTYLRCKWHEKTYDIKTSKIRVFEKEKEE